MVQLILRSNKLEFKFADHNNFWDNVSTYGENSLYYMQELIRQVIRKLKANAHIKCANNDPINVKGYY
jgi:hypothetical protein